MVLLQFCVELELNLSTCQCRVIFSDYFALFMLPQSINLSVSTTSIRSMAWSFTLARLKTFLREEKIQIQQMVCTHFNRFCVCEWWNIVKKLLNSRKQRGHLHDPMVSKSTKANLGCAPSVLFSFLLNQSITFLVIPLTNRGGSSCQRELGQLSSRQDWTKQNWAHSQNINTASFVHRVRGATSSQINDLPNKEYKTKSAKSSPKKATSGLSRWLSISKSPL